MGRGTRGRAVSCPYPASPPARQGVSLQGPARGGVLRENTLSEKAATRSPERPCRVRGAVGPTTSTSSPPHTHLVSLTPELSLLSLLVTATADSEPTLPRVTSTLCLGGEGVRKVVQLTDLPPRSSGGRVAVPWRRRATLRPPRWRDRRPRISLLGQGPRWLRRDRGGAAHSVGKEAGSARSLLSSVGGMALFD